MRSAEIAGGRAVYLGEARLCLPRDADFRKRHADHRSFDPGRGAEKARCLRWVYGLSGACAGGAARCCSFIARRWKKRRARRAGDYGEAEAMVSGVIAGLGGTLMEQYELKEMLTHVADGSVSVGRSGAQAQMRAV